MGSQLINIRLVNGPEDGKELSLNHYQDVVFMRSPEELKKIDYSNMSLEASSQTEPPVHMYQIDRKMCNRNNDNAVLTYNYIGIRK